MPRGYDLTTESAAIVRALDRQGIEGIDLVGWSYGGAIALDVALDDPGRVRTLTLIEPAAFWILRGAGRMTPESRAAFLRTLRDFLAASAHVRAQDPPRR